MRLKDFHLTYCTNIHPGTTWEDTFDSLKTHLPGIREKVAPSKVFGIGLRLSNLASLQLSRGNALQEFREWLRKNDFYVFTMNGFPYGEFHGAPVKEKVHEPDWTHPERLAYTQRLFNQLSYLLPEGLEGGVSTSPIGYRHSYPTPGQKAGALAKGASQMARLVGDLYDKERESGVFLHLDIEPEPDGLLENSGEVLSFYRDYLIPAGQSFLQEALGLDAREAEAAVRRHVNLCFDICHFALAFESPREVLERMRQNGIRVGKVQVSAALRAVAGAGDFQEVIRALKPFDEPTYLHQVSLKTEEGLRTYRDLSDFLENPVPFSELRSHFHVPIFVNTYGVLGATQAEITEAASYFREHPECVHFEVETYTWEVLPSGLKQDLENSISRELQWFLNELNP
ncbi:metabolite traffic protein EboE [Robiginitalea marina]|uniref:Metabolite traffic protein EboE n=1 Tax=Robiginitalea marina TaxID=2954105 RepID=A0ABT1AUY4_9FLAO|nr:metabolite traffic protein EboE [Robiginitalea marina]MCO5723797.1 metabolite traffic protein EboE [Robiginitalea marina]